MRAGSAVLPRQQQCFTLLEGLLAIVLLALILIGAAPFFYCGRALVHRARATRAAVELAADRIEELMDVGFDEIVSGSEEGVELHGFTYDVTTAVQTVQSDPGTGYAYKQVVVLIEWTVGAKEDDLTVVTYISNVSGGA